MAHFKKLLNKAELPAGSGKAVEVDGKSLALFNLILDIGRHFNPLELFASVPA